MNRLPFQERKTPWRAVLDVASGSYPAFVWGAPLGAILPVFHFHDVTRQKLEPHLRYLKENGYQTVTSEAMGQWAHKQRHPGPKSVVLCFDDAWASMWTVVTPLLREYEMSAITYVIPGRVADAPAVRDPASWHPGEGEPLATWPEIKAMHDSGCVDVQAHTLSHAKIFCSAEVTGFVTPHTRLTWLGRPVLDFQVPPRVVTHDMLGAPLYLARSRMSDALRYQDTESARLACMEHVAAHDGPRFFDRAGWRQELEAIAAKHPGRFETVEQREHGQVSELTAAREAIEHHLDGHRVRQVCFPWGVAGRDVVRMAQRVGYETVVADRLWGCRAMRRRTDPFHIMRLKHSYIFSLPGRGRKHLISINKRSR